MKNLYDEEVGGKRRGRAKLKKRKTEFMEGDLFFSYERAT